MKFKDRLFAGYLLSEALKDNNKIKKLNFNKLIVLGIPRGGVIVANVIADELRINNFGIIIPKKLGAPQSKEIAIGAVMKDGSTYLNEDVVKNLN